MSNRGQKIAVRRTVSAESDAETALMGYLALGTAAVPSDKQVGTTPDGKPLDITLEIAPLKAAAEEPALTEVSTLSSMPSELLCTIINMLPTQDIGRVNGVARLFHGEPPPPPPQSLVEQVLRQRAAEHGYAVPATLQEGESTIVQALCWRDISVQPRQQVVATGMHHSAFVDAEGRLLTCGIGNPDNSEDIPGLLGHGAEVHVLSVPTPVPSLIGVCVRSVAAGDNHSLVLLDGGEVLSFGDGDNGRLGHGDEEPQYQPKAVEALRGVRVSAVSAGDNHSLVLTEAGEVLSFGHGDIGSLGHGDKEDQLLPKRIEVLRSVHIVAVSAGGYHSLVLSLAGFVFSFGYGGHGLLGHGRYENRLLPKRVEALVGTHAVAVSAGSSHSLVLNAAGHVYSFGDGRQGQLGYANENQLVPRLVDALCGVRIAAISAGYGHSLAVTETGELYSFGCGDGGQLGRGDDTDTAAKLVGMPQGGSVVAVAAGFEQSVCALESGRVLGWGARYDERLGLGLGRDNQFVPKAYSHRCAGVVGSLAS